MMLKVASIVKIVFAAIALIGGVFILIGSAESSVAQGAGDVLIDYGLLSDQQIADLTASGATSADLGAATLVFIAIYALVVAVWGLFVGIVGFLASNRNAKNNLALVVGIISVVTGVLNLLNFSLVSLVGLAVSIVYLVGVFQTRKNGEG